MALLEARRLSKKFYSGDSSFYAIRRADLSFPEKGFYAIIGKSGSGKSTLLNLLSRLIEPDKGEITYRREDISYFKGEGLSYFRLNETATVFQHYNLIEGDTAIHNAMLPLLMAGEKETEAKKKAEKLFKEFGLGYLMEKKIDLLSGGEKQRVAIIRSLINEPKIIFADEPTGALDEKNSLLVMEILKDISKKRLVIMVTHNEELANEYSDRIITVKDNVASFTNIKGQDKPFKPEKKKEKYGKKWIGYFTKRNIKKNMAINGVCFLSGLIGYLSLLCAAGFYTGSEASLREQGTRSLEYQLASISEKTYLESEGSSLSLIRTSRPSLLDVSDALEGLESIYPKNDYSYFMPKAKAYELDGIIQEPATFSPVLDFASAGTSSILVKGEVPEAESFSKVVVNEEYASLFPYEIIGKKITFSYDFSLEYEGATDKGALYFDFLVSGIVREFSFLNSPRIYYSYRGLEEYLYSIELPNISAAREKKTEIPYVVSSSSGNDEVTSYSYYLFARQKDEVEDLFKLKEKMDEEGGTLSIDSSSYEIRSAYLSLTSAFSLSLIFFVAIAFIGICLIVGMIAYSNFMKRKKETAVLMALGARKRQLSDIYSNESVLVNLASGAFALALAPYVQKLLNSYILGRFGLIDFIRIPFSSFLGVPFLLPIGLLAISGAIAYFSSSIPLSAIGRMQLSDILRDE